MLGRVGDLFTGLEQGGGHKLLHGETRDFQYVERGFKGYSHYANSPFKVNCTTIDSDS